MLPRTLAVTAVAAAVLVGSSAAQSLTGTFVAPARDGQRVTLTLAQDAQGRLTGTLAGVNAQFQIDGQVDGTEFVAMAKSNEGSVYLEGMLEGTGLRVIIADVGPDGQPRYEQAREVTFERSAGAAAAPAAGGNPLGGRAGAGNPLAAAADPYVGTFAGSQFTLTLGKRGEGYEGTLRVEGGDLPVTAQASGNRLVGRFLASGTTYMFEAEVSGARMTLRSDGQTYELTREGSGGRGARPGAAAGGGAPGSGGAGNLAATPQDQQIAQLLLSTAWCHFSFRGTTGYTGSGATNTEKVRFSPDGTVYQQTGAESYSSGSAGSVAGQSSGGQTAYWRVQNGMLQLSADRMQWQPQPLEVTYNSNGSPIVKAGGKEYMVCN